MGINKVQVEGRAKEMTAKVQEEFGKVTGDKAQQAQGLVKEAVGAGQAKAGDLTEKAKDAVHDAQKALESNNHHQG